MTKFLLLSALLLVAQSQVLAADQGERQHGDWNPNKMIEHWGTNKREKESFDLAFAAIQRDLQETENLDRQKLEFLQGWAEKLLAGQAALKKRAEELRTDPTVSEKSKSDLVNRIVLYNERIKNLDKTYIEILTELKKLAEKDHLKQKSLDQIREIQQQEISNLQKDRLQKQLNELQDLLKTISDS